MTGVVVVGTGGMGRETAAWWRSVHGAHGGAPLVGFVDDRLAEDQPLVDGMPILGRVSWLDDSRGYTALIGVGDPAARAELDAQLSRRCVSLETLVHPSAVTGPSVARVAGSIVGPNVVLTRDISVGRCAIVNFGALVGHDGSIGDYAFVGPGTNLGGNVTVGTSAWVGIGATIIEGIRIGDGALVAAGAVVIDDVPDGAMAAGVPAVVRPRATGQTIP
jgi:sugar O-acyltransferase (sialic acid O-acetyltransferase NeuD family)